MRFQPNIEVQKMLKSKSTFQEVLQKAFSKKSSSRPPLIELRGLLIPYRKIVGGIRIEYLLQTTFRDYSLYMQDSLLSIARRIECEEVCVKGYIDPVRGLLHIEKITLANGPPAVHVGIPDFQFEANEFQKVITQCGKLEPAIDNLLA